MNNPAHMHLAFVRYKLIWVVFIFILLQMNDLCIKNNMETCLEKNIWAAKCCLVESIFQQTCLSTALVMAALLFFMKPAEMEPCKQKTFLYQFIPDSKLASADGDSFV